MDRLNTSRTTLRRVLQRHDVPLREPKKGRRPVSVTLAEGEAIAKAYSAGLSQEQLAARVPCSTTRIARILKSQGIDRRTSLEAHARRYELNHDAFAHVTPESAYWMAFAMADGCIVRGNTLQISLHTDNGVHLKRLCRFVGCPERPLSRSRGMSVLRLHSKRLVADLVRRGIVARKSWGTSASDELNDEPSFWLGMIDGDGSIIFTRAPAVVLCGCLGLMVQYQAFLEERVLDGRRPAIVRRNTDGLRFVSVEGRSAQRLLELLYDSSPVALDRKRRLAERALAYECDRPRRRVFSRDAHVAWREMRRAWWGTAEPRAGHSSRLPALLGETLLPALGFTEIERWKPYALLAEGIWPEQHSGPHC